MKTNWQIKKLGDLLRTLESGKRPKGGVNGISNGIPSLGGEHLNSKGSFEFENIKYVPKEFAYSMNRGVIKENDILIVKDGATTGKVSFVSKSFPYKEAVINEHLFILRPNEDVSPRYLYWYLWGSIGNEQIQKTKTGSAQGGINTRFINHVNIKYPKSKELQNVISQTLDSLFSKLDSAEADLEKVEKMLEVYRQAVLKEAFGNSNWERKRIFEIAEEVRYGSSKKTNEDSIGVPVLRMGNYDPFGNTDFTKLKYLPSNHEEFPELLLKDGDLLFNRTNSFELVGKTMVWRSIMLPVASFASYLIRVRFKKGYVPEFYSAFINSIYGRQWIKTVVNQQVGQANVNGTKLKNVEVPVPSERIQREVVEEIKKQYLIINNFNKIISDSTKTVENLRQSILKKAFSGGLV